MTDASNFYMWTIYRPTTSDLPGVWVVRRSVISGGQIYADAECKTAETLEEARALLPPGLHRLPRRPDDDPVIEECWT